MQITEKMREFDDDKQELALTIVASADEVDAAAKQFFDDINQREHKGFRKGKAPKAVLEQSVGGHANAMGGVAEVLINEYAFGAIDDADVIFLGEPQFNVDGTLEEGKPFTFSVSGPVVPEMKLIDYSPVTIEMPPEKATESEIETQIYEMRDFYHSLEPIDDEGHVAEDGDYVNLKMTITNDGKPVSGISGTTRLVGLGAGTMPDSFDENIIGHKVGDKMEFDFDAKNPDGTSDFGDGNLHADVEVIGFRKCILPELDDEFAMRMGSENVESFKKNVAMEINIAKEKELPQIKLDRAVNAAIERLDGEVPEYFVEFIRQDVSREFMKNLEDQGTNLQQWMLDNSINADGMKEDIEKEAIHRAAIDCALEAVFQEAGLEITEEDIDAIFEGDNETRKKWEDAHMMSDVRKMCRQQKAADWLADNANVEIVDNTVIIEA